MKFVSFNFRDVFDICDVFFFKFQLRLEDSVVPMGPGGGSVDRRDYRRGGNQAVTGDRYRY